MHAVIRSPISIRSLRSYDRVGTQTSAPASRIRATIAAPSPREAPVTIARLPVRSMVIPTSRELDFLVPEALRHLHNLHDAVVVLTAEHLRPVVGAHQGYGDGHAAALRVDAGKVNPPIAEELREQRAH